MASAEGEKRTVAERVGRGALIAGLALITYGLIESLAKFTFLVPPKEAVIFGGTAAASGVIFEQVGKKKK